MRIIFSALCALLFAVPFSASADEATFAAIHEMHQQDEATRNKMSEAAALKGDMVWLASDALYRFAKVAAYTDYCANTRYRGDLSDLSKQYGDWSQPGLWNRVTGKQRRSTDAALRAVRGTYTSAQVEVMNEGCLSVGTPAMLTVAEAYLVAFEGIIEKPLR